MKQKRRKSRFSDVKLRATRNLVAMGTLAAYTVAGGSRAAMAAKARSDPNGSGGPVAALPLKRFNIPAGPLEATLAEYETTTGLRVKNVLPAGTLAGFRSPGAVGLYREDEALQLLLNGTGLDFRREDAATFVVGVQAQDTVFVTDSAATRFRWQRFQSRCWTRRKA